ncbi:MAG: hypothetical protein KAR33_09630 [Candidatus Thorarchaeota archaeon]|nr:hypothetical protein [Candidatus Thorarchaeota archaeon]
MNEEKPDREDDASKMSDAIINAVNEDRADEDDDAFSRRERKVESSKEDERIRKAKELKKQLRKRELGILRYRWPTAVLIMTGIFSIFTQFLPVWIQNTLVYGFDSYWEAFLFNGNVFWLFPIISGIILIVIGYFAYARPRATFWAVGPAMMMAMAGSLVYFLIELAVIANSELMGELLTTGTPMEMLVIAVLSLLAIALREKE